LLRLARPGVLAEDAPSRQAWDGHRFSTRRSQPPASPEVLLPATAPAPVVAIATPVYNGGRYLAETMECVQAQTWPHIIHYILDNASSDNTPQIIASYANRRIPVVVNRNPQTLPMLENWNAVLRLVPPEAAYFRILPADDLIAPDAIEKMVTVGERYPEVSIIGCQEWANNTIHGDGLPSSRAVFDGRAIVRGCLLNVIHGFPHLHCLYRIPLNGLPDPFYDTEYYGTPLLSIDVDAGMRALSQGKYGYVHEPLVTTRKHAESVTSTQVAPNFLKLWSELQLIDRWGPKVFDTHRAYLRCRARHLHFYYRHLMLWRARNDQRLLLQHREWLRLASAEPTFNDYARALLEWPFVRAARQLRKAAVRLRLRPFYYQIR
jgi:glycosyltransferase involved in cell wall biosynthesis